MSYCQGKKVFITGGTAGIGLCLARAMAQDGASVVVCARGQEGLDSTLAALKVAGPQGVHGAVAADVADAVAVQAAAQRAVEILGGLDILVCMSGFAKAGPLTDVDDADFRRMMDVNFFGHVNAFRALQDHFIKQGHGDVVFVSSMAATFSVWGYGAYSASKFAITGFAEAVRQEMMLHGVRVKLFMPPTTETPGYAKENEGKPALLHELETGSALNATHKPEKIARALLNWLPKSRFFGVATWDSKLQWFLARHVPELMLKMADGELRGAKKRLEKKKSVR